MTTLPAQLLIDEQAILGEGPLWHSHTAVLWWVDIERGLLRSYRPADGVQGSHELGGQVTAVAATNGGALLIARNLGIERFEVESLRSRPLSQPTEASSCVRMNDGKCDPVGRFWVGSMTLDGSFGGHLWSYSPSDGWRVRLSGISCSNGIGWSRDGRTMFYIDSYTGRVDRLEYDATSGEVRNRRELAVIPPLDGVPDGMTMDAEGCLWVALWGGGRVVRLDPESGARLAEVRVPVTQVTSCVFGGAALDTLYITSARQGLSAEQLTGEPLAGGVFHVNPGVAGLPADEYRE